MKSIVVANWKMNPTAWREAKQLFDATKDAVDTAKNISVVVVPPALYLRELRSRYKGKRIQFGLQNINYERVGAHTGDISCVQAKDSGASYVLVGHAERRGLGETNEDTARKVSAALAEGIIPILCVGESSRHTDGEYFTVVKEQLRIAFASVTPAQLGHVIVTYEPLWTIGSEKAMNPHEMHEMAIFIRKVIVELHGEKGMNMKILYGGSATESNSADMLKNGDVDGLLVGHVSIDPERFALLLQAIASV